MKIRIEHSAGHISEFVFNKGADEMKKLLIAFVDVEPSGKNIIKIYESNKIVYSKDFDDVPDFTGSDVLVRNFGLITAGILNIIYHTKINK
jgi:hypothetical protein